MPRRDMVLSAVGNRYAYLESWKEPATDVPNYAAGSWGTTTSFDLMLARRAELASTFENWVFGLLIFGFWLFKT